MMQRTAIYISRDHNVQSFSARCKSLSKRRKSGTDIGSVTISGDQRRPAIGRATQRDLWNDDHAESEEDKEQEIQNYL
ncbi:hypothetical protein PUN28_008771 [Cardiocondyla obscurior]|uniref:Uncharacterized protein n=1 Tax=Cardiocondyla obscurior TaxID=286306 RepID=A0AAW2FUG4_9HYME